MAMKGYHSRSVPCTAWGRWVQEYRKKFNLSRSDMSDRVGVPYDTIVAWEHKGTHPRKSFIRVLAVRLGLPEEKVERFIAHSRAMRIIEAGG